MRNITVSVDDETHRAARICAAELDTSVSALVGDFLRCLADENVHTETGSGDSIDAERKSRRERIRSAVDRIAARGGGVRMTDNLSREELHDRDALR